MSQSRLVVALALKVLSVSAVLLTISGAAKAQEACYTRYDSCLSSADDRLDACVTRCDETSASDSCYTRCEKALERSAKRCDDEVEACESGVSVSPTRSRAASPSKPSMVQGNGCYLGECPDDDDPAPVSRPPVTQPGTQTGTQPVSVPQTSWICQTPAFWCAMGQAGPVGMSCWCNVPYYGFANGMIVPQG